MRVSIGDVRLFVDVEGAALEPAGNVMRQKPQVVVVHGGPGADHSHHKPALTPLSHDAQLIYYDHRGNGRSDDGDPAKWTLAQWGDDLHALILALGLDKPIVLGTSFGGFVAQSFATRHPEALSKLILISTAAHVDFEQVFAAFHRLCGKTAGDIARSYWSNPTSEGRAEYARVCAPLYTLRADTSWLDRAIMRNATALHFNGPNNEHGRMDFRADLARVACPVLVMVGQDDPITPQPFSDTIVDCLPDGCASYHRYAECGHGVLADHPEALETIRDFILKGAA